MEGRVTLTLVAPDTARAGAAFPVTLRLTNTTQDSVSLVHAGFADRIYFDVIVNRVDGSRVWNYLSGRTMLLAAHTRQMAPGEVINLAVVWNLRDNADLPVTPGVYAVHGKMLAGEPPSTDEMTTAEKRVTVLP